jgi:predicted RNase H-like nuclease
MLARGETDEADGNGAGFVAGLDGCPAGWIVALLPLAGEAPGRIGLWADFADFITALPGLAAIAVDMPIGLPDAIRGPGRPAEQAVRPLLGARQSSVFSIPVRAAVEAPDYRAACAAALAGSDPPRKVSKQGFNIFPRIREVDHALRAEPGLAARVIETHPEVVFRRIAGAPLAFPKKTREGASERQALLAQEGVPTALIHATPPRGAALNDLLDAIACSVTALRFARGQARPNPDPFPRDRYGLPIAIWS